jgi:NAD(P)-dependent dehydrogenase (short-subunit alcohol dehydrogenase family)
MEPETKATLKGKVSIITGAGSGIGRACAKLLLSQKSKVVLVEINQESLISTGAELKALGDSDSILSLRLNACSETDMAEMASQTLERFGRIDHLIASAGILRVGGTLKTTLETSLEEWQAVLQTNLTGTFLSNRAVLPSMIEQKQGDIINISSVSGRQGRAFDAAYCASKFGIIGLSESLAQEVSSYGIRVQTILPDAVDTPFWDQNGPNSIKAPLKLPPERVAELIVHLITLPRDTFMLNPVIAPFKARKKRTKDKDV